MAILKCFRLATKTPLPFDKISEIKSSTQRIINLLKEVKNASNVNDPKVKKILNRVENSAARLGENANSGYIRDAIKYREEFHKSSNKLLTYTKTEPTSDHGRNIDRELYNIAGILIYNRFKAFNDIK